MTPAPGSMTTNFRNRRLGAMAGWLSALAWWAAIITYDPADASWLNLGGAPSQNLLAYPGSCLASLALELFGLAGFWLATVPALVGVAAWRPRGRVLPAVAGGIWLVVAGAALAGLSGGSFMWGPAPVPLGGQAGLAMSAGLVEWLGLPGGLGLPVMLACGGVFAALWGVGPAPGLVGKVAQALAGAVALALAAKAWAGGWLSRLRSWRPRALHELRLPLGRRPQPRRHAPAEPGPPVEPTLDLGGMAATADPGQEPSLGLEAEEGPLIRSRHVEPVVSLEEPEPPAEPEPEPEALLPLEAQAAPEPEPQPARQAPEVPRPVVGPRILPRAETPVAQPATAEAPERDGQGLDAYRLPPLDLLAEPRQDFAPDDVAELQANCRLLEEKLADFGVKGSVREVAPGPVVTMYEFKPDPGVRISRVAGLSDDLAMNLKAKSVRIVAPIPGKAVIGIEIPSQRRETVYLREVLGSPDFQEAPSRLTFALGKDILGGPKVTDLAKMPHLLIAGATGAGKSVFLNGLVVSLLYNATPHQVRMLMVDPKRIELSTYNDIPHLLHPIITDPSEATAGLRWAVREMERRYELLARAGVRNLVGFNQKLEDEHRMAPPDGGSGGLCPDPAKPDCLTPLPYLVIIIDELADLMMVASKEVETLITRLAQMARAAGIHLVLATQRPSVDVITGLIKANFPARISFQVSSRIDSRTILDQQGAEHLLGKGDLLFLPPGTGGLTRAHAAWISDREIEAVVKFWKNQGQPAYDDSIVQAAENGGNGDGGDFESDELYQQAVAVVRQMGQASISGLQRRMRVGYNRAARMIEQMEAEGIVGPADGSKPREVLQRD